MLARGKHTSVSRTYLWALCSWHQGPCFEELWPRRKPPGHCLFSATPPEWAVLSLSELQHGCTPTTAGTGNGQKGPEKWLSIHQLNRNRGAGMRFWCWHCMKCEFSSLHCCLFQFSEQKMRTTEDSEVQNCKIWHRISVKVTVYTFKTLSENSTLYIVSIWRCEFEAISYLTLVAYTPKRLCSQYKVHCVLQVCVRHRFAVCRTPWPWQTKLRCECVFVSVIMVMGARASLFGSWLFGCRVTHRF